MLDKTERKKRKHIKNFMGRVTAVYKKTEAQKN